MVVDAKRPVIRRNLLQPFEIWVASLAVYSGLSKFFPSIRAGTATAVAYQFPQLVNLWSALYALGGLLMLLGLAKCSPRIEAAGLHFLGSGVTVAFIATLAAGAPVVPTLIVQGGVALACAARLWMLRRVP